MAQGVSFPVILRGSTAVPGSYAPVLLRLIAPGSSDIYHYSTRIGENTVIL